MKYRFYIASIFNGAVYGTNDPEIAKEAALSDDDFVIDAEEGKWLYMEDEETDIPEYGVEPPEKPHYG